MKNKLIAFLMGMFFFAFIGIAKGQTSGPIADDPDVVAAIKLLEAYIDSQIAYRSLPSISIAIVHDQEIICSRAYGLSDLERQTPATLETIYRIGSISKLFTSTAVLALKDKGKLRLDDRVDMYLPWFQPRSEYADVPPITIRHLLTHTSGLPADSLSPYWNTFEFPSSKEIAEKVKEQELTLPTQSRFKYSNLGFAVVGELVAVVAGVPFEQFVREQILLPLSMSSTFLDLPDTAKYRLATGYGRRMSDGTREVLPYFDTRGITPAAGFSTTVNDLARFASWQFRLLSRRANEVLEPFTLREMQSIQWLHPSWQWGWGLGFEIDHYPERDLVGHGGLVGGYRTAFYLSPGEKLAVIVLTNSVDNGVLPGETSSIVDRAFEWIAPAVEKATKSSTRVAKPGLDWDIYEGTYRAWWTDLQVLELKGELVLIYPRAENPGEYMLTLVPEGDKVFRVEGDGFDETGERITFEDNNDGEIVGLWLGNGHYDRIDYQSCD